MLKFRILRPSDLRLAAQPSSLFFLSPFQTLRSWVHSFGYSRPHLSSICHYYPSLFANDFGLLWVLRICAAHGWIDPRERSCQALGDRLLPLGLGKPGICISRVSSERGQGMEPEYICPLDSEVSFLWKESSSQLGRNITEEQHSVTLKWRAQSRVSSCPDLRSPPQTRWRCYLATLLISSYIPVLPTVLSLL